MTTTNILDDENTRIYMTQISTNTFTIFLQHLSILNSRSIYINRLKTTIRLSSCGWNVANSFKNKQNLDGINYKLINWTYRSGFMLLHNRFRDWWMRLLSGENSSASLSWWSVYGGRTLASSRWRRRLQNGTRTCSERK